MMNVSTFRRGVVSIVVMMCLAVLTLAGCADLNATKENASATGNFVISDVESGDAWTEDSADIIIHFVSEDADADFYHAVHDNDETATIEMVPGHYKAEALPIITADGYLLISSGNEEFDIKAGSTTEAALTFTKSEAKATVEQLDAYLAAVDLAAENSDDTVTEEVIAHIVDLVSVAKAAITAESATKISSIPGAPGSSGASAGNSGSNGESSASVDSFSAPAQSTSVPNANSGFSSSSNSGHKHTWVTITVDGEKFTECNDCGVTKGGFY